MSVCTLAIVIALVATSCQAFTWDEPTALDEYVHREDGAYTWQLLTSYRFDNDSCTVYILNMTSQYWMDDSFSSQPLWWHFMGVAVPDVITRDFAYMYIDGGSNSPDREPPGPDDSRVTLARSIAKYAGYFGAFVLQVPNQGVVFANDPDQVSRTEDAFIAWTWRTYLDNFPNTPPEVIARMPMTKASKKGLDTINEFVLSILPDHDITQFCVGGGSKRGWTSWSLAATDRRVIAVTPYVMSLLNFNDTLQAHYRNLGGWSWVFNDYYQQNLTQYLHDDRVTNWENGLWNYEDMFRYKERLELIPRLVVSGAGDEFFLLTDSHNWWDKMGGRQWMFMNQNAEHSLVPWYDKIGQSTIAWLMLIMEDSLPEAPVMNWLRGPTSNGGRILLSVDTVPDDIYAWVAHTWRNETSKDFRLVTGTPPYIHPVLWTKTNVTNNGPGSYDVIIDMDLPGFAGVFIDVEWTRLVPGLTLHLTTEVEITPDTFPYPACYGADCWGIFV